MKDTLPPKKRVQILRILMISYKYLDKTIPFGNLGRIVKNYYEQNSRGFMKFDITQRTISVPRLSTQIVSDSVAFVRKLLPDSFDVFIHLCNPKTSRYGKKHVITWASTTNVIHEVGHAIGLSHANQTINGKLQTSRDAFSQMTIHAPYPSLNPVHRLQLNWFLDGEMVDLSDLSDLSEKDYPKVYKLYKLSDLNDRTNLKVIRKDNYFISYGSLKSKNYLVIHKLNVEKPKGFFKWTSILIARYVVVEGREYENTEAGLCIEVVKSTGPFTLIKMPMTLN